MTIAELLQAAAEANQHSDTALLDSELLLGHVLGVERTHLKTWPERSVDDAVQRRFTHLMQRRVSGEPVAYLIGTQGFWTLELEVSEATLIPRPETELLVEVALDLPLSVQAAVLDLGTRYRCHRSGAGQRAQAVAHYCGRCASACCRSG